MIGGSHVIQNTETVSLFGLEKPSDPCSTVISEFKEKFLLVTSMRDMPDMTRQEISIGFRQISPPFFISGLKWRA